MPGRFILGLGTGENLNEHILANRWPPASVRREMLKEAIEIIRLLWQGGQRSYYGKYYKVENARLYTLPTELPPIMVAASGPRSAKLAGQIADGYIGTAPKGDIVRSFQEAGGAGKPRYGEVTVCWGENEAQARHMAYEWWPISGFKGELLSELSVPAHFQQAAGMIDEEDVAKDVVCGPDPKRHLGEIKKFADAGFDHVFVHQIGPDQKGFLEFYKREVLPKLRN